jgi:hypothetical protein
MLCCPFYTPISAVSSWGWWLHATSASGRRAPATEHIWMPLNPRLFEDGFTGCVRVLDVVSNTARSATQPHAAPSDEVIGLCAMHLPRAPGASRLDGTPKRATVASDRALPLGGGSTGSGILAVGWFFRQLRRRSCARLSGRAGSCRRRARGFFPPASPESKRGRGCAKKSCTVLPLGMVTLMPVASLPWPTSPSRARSANRCE